MRNFFKTQLLKLLTKSLIIANRERKEEVVKHILENIIPDLSNQYTTWKIDMSNSYLVNKIRNLHSFQMTLASKAIKLLEKDTVNIVDIGDSSGTHLIYLKNLHEDVKLNTMSINLDPIAVERIKSRGLNAILCRAEELHLVNGGIKADIFLSYEMLEHLFDPITFLHTMALKSECEFFVITIPYVYKSRVSLGFIKNNLDGDFYAENTHVFELSPEDWNLIFKFSGWGIVYSEKYTQYPKHSPFVLTKYLWRKIDFDGFYGVILQKNNKYSKRYLDW